MILVIGGAGYIGSRIVKELIQQNQRVVVLDGQRENVNWKVVFEKGNCENPQDLDWVFSRYSIDMVIHAGSGNVEGRSYKGEAGYIPVLLQKMMEYSVDNLIFYTKAGLHRASGAEGTLDLLKQVHKGR
ncbi:MAG: NAD-dependent epimerase/dehydratase family protein [Ectobacillus sp.]